jgi:intracellular multiplication protein IcmP
MSGAGQGEDKNSMAILWIIGSIFFIGTVMWFGFNTQIKYVFIKIRMLEMYLVWFAVKFLPSSIPTIAALQEDVYKALEVSKRLTPEILTGAYAMQISEITGKYLRFPITIFLAWFCYLMYGRNVKMRYRKKYDMHTLAEQEAVIWPQINPILNANIVEQDLNSGPWAMAQPPVDFCKHYNLINIRVEMPNSILSKGPKFIMELNKERADRVFAAQLGRLWSGPENLPLHKRAIFAAFVARGCRDTKAARDLLEQINRSCVGGKLDKLDFSGADELWKKHINDHTVAEIISKHAYESTVFMALFLYAREDGVFATADFLWLKPFDRKFWYLLNNVGRQVAFCEAAGVHAHYLAECALQRPLGVPMVAEATKALQMALDDIIYTPTPEEREELLKQYAF